MNYKVTHFIRKSTQLRASFIQNQIVNHIGYEPSVVYKTESEIDDGGFADFKNEEIKILSLKKVSNIFSRLIFKILKLISFKDSRHITKFTKNSDILHFHYGTDAGIYLPILTKINKPKVVSFYGYECSGFPRRFFGLGKRYLISRTFRHVDKVFAMSPDMKKDLITSGCPEEKIIVHYYGTNTQLFFQKHQYKRNHKKINFLIISGLAPQKGHFFLLKAFKHAYKKNADIRLTIVGEGPLREEIYQFITTNKMEYYVDLKGKTTYASAQHMNYFKEADIFIHPSITDVNGDKEGIPGAIVEAMAAGLPVISTNHAGIPFIIDNGESGLLVNEWDTEALAETIIKLATNNNLRKQIGKAGQVYALNNLALHKKEIELEQIYEDLI